MTQPSLDERVRAAVHDAVTAAAQNPGAGRGLVVSLITSAVMAEVHRQTSAAPPPADRAALRDRIRRAICEANGFDWDPDMLEPDEYGDHADAVLAVLPTTDRAAEIERLRTENARMRHELEVMYGGAFDSPNRKHATGRAAVLREAAEFGRELSRQGYSAQEIAKKLDRMADEAQGARTHTGEATS
jgi:hypothetical protein